MRLQFAAIALCAQGALAMRLRFKMDSYGVEIPEEEGLNGTLHADAETQLRVQQQGHGYEEDTAPNKRQNPPGDAGGASKRRRTGSSVEAK